LFSVRDFPPGFFFSFVGCPLRRRKEVFSHLKVSLPLGFVPFLLWRGHALVGNRLPVISFFNPLQPAVLTFPSPFPLGLSLSFLIVVYCRLIQAGFPRADPPLLPGGAVNFFFPPRRGSVELVQGKPNSMTLPFFFAVG